MLIGFAESSVSAQLLGCSLSPLKDCTRLQSYPTWDAAVLGLSIGSCDWLIADPEQLDTLSERWSMPPVGAVVNLDHQSNAFAFVAWGDCVGDAEDPDGGECSQMRTLWRLAWVRWLERALIGHLSVRLPDGFLTSLLSAALEAHGVPHLAAVTGMSDRSLRRRLARSFSRVRPRGILASARVLYAWELLRLKEFTVKAVASQVGWADGRAMARSTSRILGCQPTQLAWMSPTQMARSLSEHLAEGGTGAHALAKNALM